MGRRYKSAHTDGQDNTTPNATKYFGGRRIRKSLNDKRRYYSRKSRSRNRRNKY